MFLQSLRLFKISYQQESTNRNNFIISLLLELVSIGLLYLLNKQYGSLYDGIATFNTHKIWQSMVIFAGLAGVLVVVGGFTTFFLNRLAFGIREGLNIFYCNNFKNLSALDNLEQRLQEDLKNFGERSVEFWFTVSRSILRLPVFLGVVITLTQWWVGVILVAAVVLGTYATKRMAGKLIKLQVWQETNEANYRQNLKKGSLDGFQYIKYTFQGINTQIKKLSFLQSGLGQTFVLLPFVVLMPLYLAKMIPMGILMQAANAMGRVIDSLTVLIEQRQLIVNISTCLLRMEVLDSEQKENKAA